MTREYWGAGDADKLVSHLQSKINRTTGQNSGSSTLYDVVSKASVRNEFAYYSNIITPQDAQSSLQYAGDMGELVKMNIPLARTYVRQFCSLITKERINIEAIVDINDVNPTQTAKIGKALANNLVDKQKIDLKQLKLAEKTCLSGISFLSCIWDENAGVLVTQNFDGSPVYSGDNKILVSSLHEVTFDYYNEDWDAQSWVVIAEPVNRYDLAAVYPDQAQAILNAPSVNESTMLSKQQLWTGSTYDSDTIYKYHFYHKRSPAVPSGRNICFVDGGVDNVLKDNVYNKDYLPINSVIFEQIDNTGLGYPFMSSLLPAQEMIDSTLSTIASNQSALGVNIVAYPEGQDMGVNDISKGLKFLPYKPMPIPNGGLPQSLQLSRVDGQFFQFSSTLQGLMQDISMLNSTMRGSPPPNVSSGAMAATLIATSMEFLTPASGAINLALERVLTYAIQNYQDFGNEAHLVEIVGDNNLAKIQAFKKEDISKISRIKLRRQSALMQTTSGRMALGESLLKNGIGDAKKFVNLVEGAPVDSLYSDNYDEEAAVKSEIDAIFEGKPIAPQLSQNHPKYIQAYKSLLDNPHFIVNSNLVGGVIDLMRERLKMESLLQQDSQLFTILRGQPPPAPVTNVQNPQGLAQQTPDYAAPSAPAQPLPIPV